MSTVTTDAKAVVQGYLDALLAGDLEGIRACFAPDATWTIYGDLPIAGPWHGRDAIVDDFLGEVAGTLFEPGSPSFEFPTLLAEGDTVALEWRVQARTTSGRAYENAYCGMFVIRDVRIQSVREYLDSGYAARMLSPPPEATSATTPMDGRYCVLGCRPTPLARCVPPAAPGWPRVRTGASNADPPRRAASAAAPAGAQWARSPA